MGNEDAARRRRDETAKRREDIDFENHKRRREDDGPMRLDNNDGDDRNRGPRAPPPRRRGGAPHSGERGGRIDRSSGGMNSWRDEQYIKEKLSEIKEPVLDLPPLDFKDVMFQSRSRLFVTHLPNGVLKEEIVELFKPYGQVDDVYVHKDFFSFSRMDYYYNAVKAKCLLDNTMFKGRKIRVRLAPQSSIIVKNLPPFVSNELLHLAFSVFGDVDYCTVLADSRGHSLDEGIVDFKLKKSVTLAKKYCNEHFYLLTSHMKPVYVEDYDLPHDNDGVPEEQMKKPPMFVKAREKGPRFAIPGSFEYQYAEKYKQLYEDVKAKTIEIKIQSQDAERALETEFEEAEFDYETEKLKVLLMHREMQRERLRGVRYPDKPEGPDPKEQWARRRANDSFVPEGHISNEPYNQKDRDRYRPEVGARIEPHFEEEINPDTLKLPAEPVVEPLEIVEVPPVHVVDIVDQPVDPVESVGKPGRWDVIHEEGRDHAGKSGRWDILHEEGRDHAGKPGHWDVMHEEGRDHHRFDRPRDYDGWGDGYSRERGNERESRRRPSRFDRVMDESEYERRQRDQWVHDAERSDDRDRREYMREGTFYMPPPMMENEMRPKRPRH